MSGSFFVKSRAMDEIFCWHIKNDSGDDSCKNVPKMISIILREIRCPNIPLIN